MKKISFALLIAVLPMSLAAENLQDTVPQAKTKIEQFSAKTGIVLIRGFHKIGNTQGLYNTSVNIEAKEFTNVTDGTKQYGITIEAFKENGQYDKDHTSFIDYDEIDSLVKGIEYISKVKASVTKLDDFQADYSTRGDLKISTFSSGEQIMAAVTSGNIGAVAAYFNIDDLEKVKALIVKAKNKIDEIKA
ncbi:hypothetical protein DFO83_104219 [Idiomarina loihiensis]|uniref:hypothetical protein n=1 Tax=Idiomarina TaxID=135575 RepID=UPI00054E453F|nr:MULTISPECIES: hypothetical protein [Idiomarina]NWO03854.1 hypothetical protein [Idiomarinaceae bacterium]PWW38519.1 hypothetical protein DFO83_104219 [Idiomarina loihiensis]TDP48407.1 hypothetical protein DET58_10484 [Idiomarina loihiensis]TDS23573.1 hypothetical protein DET62_10484 [Idiomarina sp. H2]